jgi:small conductance mechanosensitive channel
MFSATAAPPPQALLPQALTKVPDCVGKAHSWCSQVWDATHVAWLASAADWLIAKPLRILLILVIAVVVRWLLRRVIDRAIRDRTSAGQPKTPALIRPLKERASTRAGASLASERRRQRAKTVASLLKSITSFVVYGVAIILILGELGINLAPILASAGVIGVAVAFGAQNLVRDFLSGMFMIVEDQYGVGDWVDTGEASGTVEAVGLRVTTLRDIGGAVWYVRNGSISRVGNYNQSYGVAVLDVPLGFGVHTDRACEVVMDSAVTECEREPLSADVLEKPTLWGVQGVDNQSVTVRVTVKTKPGSQFAVARALRAAALAAVNDAGLEHPLAWLLDRNGTE